MPIDTQESTITAVFEKLLAQANRLPPFIGNHLKAIFNNLDFSDPNIKTILRSLFVFFEKLCEPHLNEKEKTDYYQAVEELLLSLPSQENQQSDWKTKLETLKQGSIGNTCIISFVQIAFELLQSSHQEIKQDIYSVIGIFYFIKLILQKPITQGKRGNFLFFLAGQHSTNPVTTPENGPRFS
jgi:hypothetical protein